jgi:PAS domain S-box-containing protein
LDRSALLAVAAAGLFLFVILALTSLGLLGSWRQSYRATGEQLDSKVALMGQSTARTLQAVETTLAILDDEVVAAHAKGPEAMRDALSAATRRILRFTPHVRQILLTDSKGGLLFDTANTGGPLPPLDALGLTRAARINATAAGLVIGRPVPGRYLGKPPSAPPPPGLWVIPAARPLSDGTGRLLIATLSPGAILEGFVEALTLESSGTAGEFAGLYGAEGDLLAGLPRDRINEPWTLPPNQFMADLAKITAYGHRIMEVPFHGDRGWVSWWRDSRYPIVVFVGRTDGRITADWSETESIVILGAGIFVAIMAIATLIFVPLMSQRLRLRARIRVLEQAVEKGPAAVLITDPEARIEYVNDSFTRLTGYSPRDALGQTPNILRSGHTDPEVFSDMWRTIRDGRSWRGEILNRTRDGHECWVDMAIAGVKDDLGETIHYIGIQVDISDRKHVEERLQDLVKRLDQSNRDLEQFAYVASHDLQEPLRMVTSYLSLLRRRLAPVMTDEAVTFMDFAENGARRMRQMIEDLLQYSRAGTRVGEPEPVDLKDALEDATAHLAVAIRDAGAKVSVATGLPMVMGNRPQLSRLLMNLIGNAIKYRDKDRAPRIDLFARSEGPTCHLTIVDNGQGIAKEEQERVLQPFQRGASARDTEGTGIGLAICKKIAEKYGGSLTLESELGKGTRFTLSLPLAPKTPD